MALAFKRWSLLRKCSIMALFRHDRIITDAMCGVRGLACERELKPRVFVTAVAALPRSRAELEGNDTKLWREGRSLLLVTSLSKQDSLIHRQSNNPFIAQCSPAVVEFSVLRLFFRHFAWYSHWAVNLDDGWSAVVIIVVFWLFPRAFFL